VMIEDDDDVEMSGRHDSWLHVHDWVQFYRLSHHPFPSKTLHFCNNDIMSSHSVGLVVEQTWQKQQKSLTVSAARNRGTLLSQFLTGIAEGKRCSSRLKLEPRSSWTFGGIVFSRRVLGILAYSTLTWMFLLVSKIV
jgi:hypothetical protein